MTNIRKKQQQLEKTCKLLIQQNNELFQTNRKLWKHIIDNQNREQNERKIEKLIIWFAEKYFQNSYEQGNFSIED